MRLCQAFARRRRMDRERVHAASEFAGQCRVDHAVPLEPALSFERVRHDIDPVMRLPARPVPGMAFVLVRFVHHLEALRGESFGQLTRDNVCGLHAAGLMQTVQRGQSFFGIAAQLVLSSLERVVRPGA